MCVYMYKRAHTHVPVYILISFCFSPAASCIVSLQRTHGKGYCQRPVKHTLPHVFQVLPNGFNAFFIYEVVQISELHANAMQTNVY